MAMAEVLGLNDAIPDVNFMRQRVDAATNCQEIEQVVIKAAALVVDGKMPLDDAALLVCHAQIRFFSLQNGDGKIAP